MSTDLREAFRRAAEAVPPLGDAERAVRSGRRRRRAATVAAPLAVLALVGGVWFVAAGSLGGDKPSVTEADAALRRSTWVLESYSNTGDPTSLVDVPDDVQSTLEFEDGILGVVYGCNTGGAEVTVADSTIEYESIFSTEMRCGPAETRVERSVGRVLAAEDVLTYVTEGDSLTITSDGRRLVYRATS